MKSTALITGASSGIGYELAKIFAREGYDLVLVARSAGKLQELAQSLTGTKVHVIAKDLSDPKSSQEVFNEVQAKGLGVDVLVNNAGFGDYGNFVESDWKKQREMIDLNVLSLTHLTHLFLPNMVKNKQGRIMNVASTAAFQPGPLMAVYYATKSYVLHFSEAIANELEGTGVTVTALCPGATRSGFQAAADMEKSRLVNSLPMPTSQAVAEYGYRATMKGKKVAIHGCVNWLMAFAIRFTPRWMVLRLVRFISNQI